MTCLRRSIEIGASKERAWAAVEDDFHHFRVWVWFAHGVVTGATSFAVRYPWSACPLAGERLSELVGMRLSPESTAVLDQANIRFQCTHMFDLAGLAIAAASRGILRRRYALEVPDRVAEGTAPTLWRDGVKVMSWRVAGTTVLGPAPFEGVSLKGNFVEWVRAHLSLDEAEAALVLRRGVFISNGRGLDLDLRETAGGMNIGACITFQPERAVTARRMKGSTRDFSPSFDLQLMEEKTWPSEGRDPPPTYAAGLEVPSKRQ